MKNINSSLGFQKTLLNIFFIALFPIALYFIAFKAFPKLIISEQNYGEYYAERVGWLFTHALFGICATVLGPLQFIKSIRNKHLRLHRIIGKAYLISVLIASLCAMYLAFTSSVTLTYTLGLFVIACLWLITGAKAYQLIRKRNINKHKEWMIRNYVITFFFIVFFLIHDIFKASNVGDLALADSILAWACWIVPLSIAEYFIRRARQR